MFLSLPQPQRVGNNFTTTFTGVSGVTYDAEWSSTLFSKDWTPITAGVQHAFSLPVGSNTRFFVRLKVTGLRGGKCGEFRRRLPPSRW